MFIPVVMLSLGFGAGARAGMTPTAPQKMTSPDEAKQMRECQQQAAQNNVKMDERAKYVMDCMTGKAKSGASRSRE